MEPSGNTTIEVPALRGVDPRVYKIVATANVSRFYAPQDIQ